MSLIEPVETPAPEFVLDHRAARAPEDGDEQSSPLTAPEWHRLIGEFSHDLRTPLCVAGESACLLRDGEGGSLDHEWRESLEVIRDQLEHIHFLVDALLSVSRWEAEGIGPAIEPFPLDVLLERVSRQLARYAAERRVPFEAVARGAFPTIQSDRRAVGTVLLALGRFALRRSDRSRPVALEAGTRGSAATCEVRVAYSGRRPDPKRRFGLRDQLRVAQSDDCGVLTLELALAQEFSRRGGGEFSVGGGAAAVELRLSLPTAEDAPAVQLERGR